MAVFLLVPVAVVTFEEVALAIGVAAAAAHVTTSALGHSDIPKPEPHGGHPEPEKEPRNVTPGEQNLARDIAGRLEAYADLAQEAAQYEHDHPHQSIQQPNQPDPEPMPITAGADIRNAVAEYRRIVTTMLASQAAGIATPGLRHITSVLELVEVYRPLTVMDLQLLIEQAGKLASSLILPIATM